MLPYIHTSLHTLIISTRPHYLNSNTLLDISDPPTLLLWYVKHALYIEQHNKAATVDMLNTDSHTCAMHSSFHILCAMHTYCNAFVCCVQYILVYDNVGM